MRRCATAFAIGQSARFGRYYPWTLPLQVHAADGRFTAWAVGIGLAGGALVTVLAAILFSRREVE